MEELRLGDQKILYNPRRNGGSYRAVASQCRGDIAISLRDVAPLQPVENAVDSRIDAEPFATTMVGVVEMRWVQALSARGGGALEDIMSITRWGASP